MTVAKRVFLFMAVNLLVMLTISIVLQFLGIGHYLSARGVDYRSLAVFCLVWGMGGAFVSLTLSRVIAKWSMGVKILDPRSGDALVKTVHALARRAGLPAMPEVGIYDSPEPNAFATGPTRSRALVAVSTGLLGSMNQVEIEGVLAHEVAHIANGDMVTMTLVQGVVNAFVMFLARIIAFALSRGDRDNRGMVRMTVFALEMAFGVLGMVVVAWFSRRREFRADAGSAKLGGREKMIAALQALQRRFEPSDEQEAFATLKIAGGRGGFLALISTHPPIKDRIEALRRG
ncbi:MAG: protease HtpX [Elusimicrobia bacterium CG11_big_fil_rev_8_21_14_0_20_64_6]|nr:MAG: protease HtpX [Elusimicrobia bacterium CG11_big_fil_rev_8_21_14_0_20_64_6]